MEVKTWLILVLMPGLLISQSNLKGFELLDNLAEDFIAGDNIVQAETPFSSQLSLCFWINPTWVRPGKSDERI